MLYQPLLADPPLCTLGEMKTVLNIDDLMDLNEVLILKAELHNAATEHAKRGKG